MLYLRLMIASILASAAVPVAAQEVYLGVSGGASLPNDSKNQGIFTKTVPATPNYPAIPAGTDLRWRTKFDTGYNVAGQIGIRWDNVFRTELEVTYSKYDVRSHRRLAVGGTVIDGLDSAVLTRGKPSASDPTVGKVLDSGIGDVENLGGFLNFYYDIPTHSAFRPYFGGGVGVERVKVNYSPSNVKVVQDSSTAFAYQLGAGASFRLSKRVELFGQYNYRTTSQRINTNVSLLPATLGVESQQSLFNAGVRLNFGH